MASMEVQTQEGERYVVAQGGFLHREPVYLRPCDLACDRD
jgi:hypothetical protein